MGWRESLGSLAATTVLATARLTRVTTRPLSPPERSLLGKIFERGLDLDAVRLAEHVAGPVNASNRPFTIENTIFLPTRYLPMAPSLLVHEAVHVWQFQTAGHRYIVDSVIAQATNQAYRLDLALNGEWSTLNCEQQAVFVEHAFRVGAFERRHLLPQPLFDDAVRALRDSRRGAAESA